MKRNSPISSILLVIVIVFSAKSQTNQEVVASAGKHLESSSIQVDFTLGQLIITTETTSNITVTQGFHQSFEELVEVLEVTEEPILISVFPNPTRDFLTISSESDQKIHYAIYGLHGSRVSSGLFQKTTQLSMEKYAKGTYQLFLTNAQEQLLQTFKIQLK